MARTRDAAAGQIAARQHGLITRTQALEAGFTRATIQQWRRSGRWMTVERGVYLVSGAPRTWHTGLLAPCLAHGGVASHRSAATLLGLGGFRPGQPEITVPRGSSAPRDGTRIHESLDFDLIRPQMIDGIPTTRPGRLSVDLGAAVSYIRYERAMDELLARGLLTWEDALHHLMSHARRGRNGVGALRALLTERYGTQVGDSVFEQGFARELRRRGFPTPVGQYEIADARGFIARVDYAYPDHLLALELDSVRWHLNREGFEADPRKRNRARMAGWFVLEITWRMLVEEPNILFRQIRRLLDERAPTNPHPFSLDSARHGAPGPAGSGEPTFSLE